MSKYEWIASLSAILDFDVNQEPLQLPESLEPTVGHHRGLLDGRLNRQLDEHPSDRRAGGLYPEDAASLTGISSGPAGRLLDTHLIVDPLGAFVPPGRAGCASLCTAPSSLRP